MKEVINKINSLETKFETKFEAKLNEFERLNIERFGNLKWTLIVASAVITIVLSILAILIGKN